MRATVLMEIITSRASPMASYALNGANLIIFLNHWYSGLIINIMSSTSNRDLITIKVTFLYN